MEKLLQLSRQTAFRDKVFRLVQYASRLLSHLVAMRGAAGVASRRELLAKLANLEQHLGTARKLLRLGNSADSLYSALRSLHLKDEVHRFTVTMARIASAVFLLIDHWLWVGRVGLAKVDRQRWGALSNRFWLLSIILGLTRDAYDISAHCKTVDSGGSGGGGGLTAVLADRPLVVDTVRNVCDLFLPLAGLDYVSLSPGAQGFLGLVSSALALAVIVKPALKLLP